MIFMHLDFNFVASAAYIQCKIRCLRLIIGKRVYFPIRLNPIR